MNFFSTPKIKQFLKSVKLRKPTLTKLIANAIQKLNMKILVKKHFQCDLKIDKLLLFLP
ncbi:hypothetical protein BB050_02067 [Flavobacterium anhuiense]|uniref:Uncharacterized protein n=1 Tax=Flavobacterium anhuiense TaxID=459526 RepID=A0AAC9GIB5_9FLAO|nr:hypothetical protein BB050_02067 [Flavobacterium anhuiense]